VKKIESKFYFINLKLKEIHMREKKKGKSSTWFICKCEKKKLFNK